MEVTHKNILFWGNNTENCIVIRGCVSYPQRSNRVTKFDAVRRWLVENEWLGYCVSRMYIEKSKVLFFAHEINGKNHFGYNLCSSVLC